MCWGGEAGGAGGCRNSRAVDIVVVVLICRRHDRWKGKLGGTDSTFSQNDYNTKYLTRPLHIITLLHYYYYDFVIFPTDVVLSEQLKFLSRFFYNMVTSFTAVQTQM